MFSFKHLVIVVLHRTLLTFLHHFRDFVLNLRQEVMWQRQPGVQR